MQGSGAPNANHGVAIWRASGPLDGSLKAYVAGLMGVAEAQVPAFPTLRQTDISFEDLMPDWPAGWLMPGPSLIAAMVTPGATRIAGVLVLQPHSIPFEVGAASCIVPLLRGRPQDDDAAVVIAGLDTALAVVGTHQLNVQGHVLAVRGADVLPRLRLPPRLRRILLVVAEDDLSFPRHLIAEVAAMRLHDAVAGRQVNIEMLPTLDRSGSTRRTRAG
jgi:hypothetical protein